MWNKILQNFKEVIFPVHCIKCNREGQWWCKLCRTKNDPAPIYLCPVCRQQSDGGKCCDRCRAGASLDGAIAMSLYEEDYSVGILIRQFKYNYASDLASLWTEFVAERWSQVQLGLIGGALTVVPIPLHPRRLRERGYNQAEILARIIYSQIKKDNDSCQLETQALRRTRYTMAQARLNRSERLVNLKNAFVWSGVSAPKNILLIDDVLTTGATMQECARVLRASGAEQIWALTLARG